MQRPAELPGVAIVLRGPQGAGKGRFGQLLERLYGRHFIEMSQRVHLTGHFDAHLENKLIVFPDEAYFAGHKEDLGPLKAIITERTRVLERKGFDAVEVPNMLRVVMATNNAWAAHAAAEERRFCVLDVSDARAGDRNISTGSPPRWTAPRPPISCTTCSPST